MGAGRKTQTFTLNHERGKGPLAVRANSSASARGLRKGDTGGLIFGCTHATMKECLAMQLFGLPAQHISYVRNVEPGLPLFLFNYSDRKLHGIFEAACQGQMNINPYGWTDGSQRSPYPAQVRIHVRLLCQALTEGQFKRIIEDNYYSSSHFYFELDHKQTRDLIALFSSSPVQGSTTLPNSSVNWNTLPMVLSNPIRTRGDDGSITPTSEMDVGQSDQFNMESWLSGAASSLDDVSESLEEHKDGVVEENFEKQEEVYRRLLEISKTRERCNSSPKENAEDIASPSMVNDKHSEGECFSDEQRVSEENRECPFNSTDPHFIISKLMWKIEQLEIEQLQKMAALESKLAESEIKIQQLQNRVRQLESKQDPPSGCEGAINGSCDDNEIKPNGQHSCLDGSILIVGGYDGSSWLSNLDSYSLFRDEMIPLKPMSTVRSYASAGTLNGKVYIFGGWNGNLWYDTVECYNPEDNEWTFCPPLIEKKGNLAGATLDNKIFAIGGGNGIECFWEVEMFDPALGRWIPTRSMLQKRFAPAAAELNGVLYVVGGYDGKDYLTSAERFDPREASWTRIPSMNTRRGCHSVAVLNNKLYVLGGYDGNKMVRDVEVLDPRTGAWMTGDNMNEPRGYFGTAVIGDSIYIIGGTQYGGVVQGRPWLEDDQFECHR
ncbi:PREDICTED: uncharacterized protein LOC104604166 isoform X2 [Nelumbo nucifera]|uniref:Uncharacterized protein LOC104604166 isoform X2 n=1 Tax=Nelumbo nucifera TaxID=4432 RepID=A0A1U8AHU1_NELNU|nr:PREDICTED: uncharacterized protein LOC104604166 isoform X2 [Nelumbo nucifera]